MPVNNLHSLDALLHTIRDPESKRLAQEAITAYQAGAYRAAILSIWVAVCADIVSKLRELATGGDAGATAEMAQLDTWIARKEIRNLQQFENGVLDIASTRFEMFLPHESVDLNRLSEDRNLCAHPAFVSDEALFSPTPELARVHITHAILHLLSRPPVQGKQLIVRLDRDLLGGAFPNKMDDIEVVMRENYLSHSKAGSIVSLIKALAKALVGDEAAKYEGKEIQITQALAAIGRIYPSPYEEHLPPLVAKLACDLDEKRILILCRYVGADSRIWDWIGHAGQARILAKIDSAELTEIKHVARARNLEPIGKQFVTRLKRENIETQIKVLSKAPSPFFVSEALALYQASGSFATAEQRGNELLLTHAKYFTAEDIGKLDVCLRANYDNKKGQILWAGQSAKTLLHFFEETTSLLPAASIHWASIAQHIVDRNAAGYYDYPDFLSKLKDAGVSVPDQPVAK